MKLWNLLKEMWNNPPAEPFVPPAPFQPPKRVEQPKPADPPTPVDPPKPSPSRPSLSQWYTFGRNTPYEKAEVIFTHPEKAICRTIVSSYGYICDFPGIDETVPEEYASIARDASISFRTDFERCPDGNIQMLWEIQPDGRYWEDEDGYGGTSDEEVILWTMLDAEGRFTGPFRLYRVGIRRLDSWELRQAEAARAEGRMEEARKWYLAAAGQEITQAQYEAALLVQDEPEKSFSLMRKAANGGMPEARLALSRYVEQGFGCTPDFRQADC